MTRTAGLHLCRPNKTHVWGRESTYEVVRDAHYRTLQMEVAVEPTKNRLGVLSKKPQSFRFGRGQVSSNRVDGIRYAKCLKGDRQVDSGESISFSVERWNGLSHL